MAKIMTKCPSMRHAISTGVQVDSDVDFNVLLDVARRTAPHWSALSRRFRLSVWIITRAGWPFR